MIIIVGSTGALIAASDLLSATYRTDLVPVPATLELSVRNTPSLEKALVEGAELLVGDLSIPMIIIKTQSITTQSIKEGRRIGGIAIIAVLSGCEGLIEPMNKAINTEQTTFLSAIRACGGRMASDGDVPLPYFVCLKGGIPTVRIAQACQEEGVVIQLRGRRLAVVKLDELMDQPVKAKYDPSAVVWVQTQAMQNLHLPSFVSIDPDGSTVYGADTTQNRPVDYRPRMTQRQLKNLEKVLVHRGSLIRPLDMGLQAGDTLMVGTQKIVVLTAAHRFDSGALGGNSATVSKLWLSSL